MWFNFISLQISRNSQIQDKLAINMKMKELCATSKGLPQTLIGHCSISGGKNESDVKGRQKEGSQPGVPLGSTPSSPEELVSRERQLRGMEMVGRLLSSSPAWLLVRMVVEVEPFISMGQAGCIRPTIGRKAPQRVLEGGLKRPQRYQPGTVALHEIHWCQRSTDLLICKQPFACLVHEIAQEHGVHNLHFKVHTVQALQEAAKYYLACLFDDANLFAIHTKHVTIMPWNIHLAHCICGEQNM